MQINVKLDRQDQPRDEERLLLDVIIRPNTLAMFGQLLLGGNGDDGKPVVNRLEVYKSDLRAVQEQTEDALDVWRSCEESIERQWSEFAATQTKAGHAVTRADFPDSAQSEFERRMGRGLKPIVSHVVVGEKPSPIAEQRAMATREQETGFAALTAAVAARIQGARRGDQDHPNRR